MLNVDRLNSDYAIEGQLRFVKGRGGFPMAEIDTPLAQALISVYAGQVLSFQPKGDPEDLLFLSDTAYFESGKAIKGGIPLCWPWFGADPEGMGRSAHGFVRNRHWQSVTTKALADGSILVRIGLVDDRATLKAWPHSFQLAVEVTVGSSLTVDLVTRNTGDGSMKISQALHTYFKVGDVSRAKVLGLEGIGYLDKVDEGREKTQAGPVSIGQEVDRIYIDAPAELVIEDEALDRRILISNEGSNEAVVWNPWSAIAASMGDLGDDDYLRFLCVETANAGPERIEIGPGDTYRLRARYSVEG